MDDKEKKKGDEELEDDASETEDEDFDEESEDDDSDDDEEEDADGKDGHVDGSVPPAVAAQGTEAHEVEAEQEEHKAEAEQEGPEVEAEEEGHEVETGEENADTAVAEKDQPVDADNASNGENTHVLGELPNGEVLRPVEEKSEKLREEATFAASNRKAATDGGGVDIGNIEVELTFDVGDVTLSLKDLESMKNGYVLDINRASNEYINIRSSGRLVGRGRLVKIKDHLGVQIDELFGDAAN
ncbi:MAG: FliM/FliN family flagellar motor switch protein [Puniceicoccales bacterium]|jgi:flagellar motor switch/type III secretory pathway protein FliN|nr:FliM/FliN family flagellar motor switch protein [Puniceicoccales bacterium]